MGEITKSAGNLGQGGGRGAVDPNDVAKEKQRDECQKGVLLVEGNALSIWC